MNIINATYFVHDYHVALSVPDPGLNYTENDMGQVGMIINTNTYRIHNTNNIKKRLQNCTKLTK